MRRTISIIALCLVACVALSAAKTCSTACFECDATSGFCSKCTNGYGPTIEGVCAKCWTVTPNCAFCWDDVEKCRGCGQGYGLRPGSGGKQALEITTGDCIPCPSNCLSCDGPDPANKCLECKKGYVLDPIKRTCTKCPAFCKSCGKGAKCVECNKGYGLARNGTCAKCKAGTDPVTKACKKTAAGRRL